MTFEIINQEDLLELPSSLAPSGTSYHPLSTEQLIDLRSAMQAPIHIVSKDGRASISTPVHAVVSSACASLKYLLSLQQQRSSSPRHIQWQSQSQQQISIRGSGRFTYDNDMDFFIKSSQAPNASSPYEFRNFCLTVMIAAFDSLMGRPMQESIDSSSSTISPRASSYNLHDKVSGIFKSFFPFPDQSGCIFSLNTDPSRHGADVDITFHFRPSSTQQMSPSLSPQLATTSLPPRYTIPSSEYTEWWEMGAKSFGHDASELVIECDRAGRINLAAQHYFKALFHTNIDWVHSTLQERVLVILDTEMHLGYRRVFHEVTKRGFAPAPSCNLAGGEHLKLCRIFSLIQENDYSTTISGLDPMLQFVKSKAQDPKFILHFFANAYTMAKIVYDEVKLHSEHAFFAKRLMTILKREFVHDSWQVLFPDYVKEISQVTNPLEIICEILDIKAHLCSFRESYEKPSLLGTARLSGRPDTTHGFILARSLTVEQIKEKLSSLKELLGDPLLFRALGDELKNIENIVTSPDVAIELLFCIQRLCQNSLTKDEAVAIGAILPHLLSCYVNHQEFFARYSLEEALNHHLGFAAKDLLQEKSKANLFHAFITENAKRGKSVLSAFEILLHLIPCSSKRNLPIEQKIAEKGLPLLFNVLKKDDVDVDPSLMAELLITSIPVSDEKQSGQILSSMRKLLEKGAVIDPLLKKSTYPFFYSELTKQISDGKKNTIEDCLRLLKITSCDLIAFDDTITPYLPIKALSFAASFALDNQDRALMHILHRHIPSELLSHCICHLQNKALEFSSDDKLMIFIASMPAILPAKELFDALFILDPSMAVVFACHAEIEDRHIAAAVASLFTYEATLATELFTILSDQQKLCLLTLSPGVVDKFLRCDKKSGVNLHSLFSEKALEANIHSSNYRSNLVRHYLQDPANALQNREDLILLLKTTREHGGYSSLEEPYYRLLAAVKKDFLDTLDQAMQDLVLQEHYRLNEIEQHSAAFIAWIIKQPLTQQNATLLETSLRNSPISDDCWRKIFDYASSNVRLLERLLAAGYEKNCPKDLLNRATFTFILTCQSLEEKFKIALAAQQMGADSSALFTFVEEIVKDKEALHQKTMIPLCKALEQDKAKQLLASMLATCKEESRSYFHLLCLARSLSDPSEILIEILNRALDKGPAIYQPLFDDQKHLPILESCLLLMSEGPSMRKLYQNMLSIHAKEPIRWLQYEAMYTLQGRLVEGGNTPAPELIEAFFPYLEQKRPELVADYLLTLDAKALIHHLPRLSEQMLQRLSLPTILTTLKKDLFLIDDTKSIDCLIKIFKEQTAHLSLELKMEYTDLLFSCVKNPGKLFPIITETMSQARKEHYFKYFFFAAGHLSLDGSSRELDKEKKKIKKELEALFSHFLVEHIPDLAMVVLYFKPLNILDEKKIFISLLDKLTSCQEITEEHFSLIDLLFSDYLSDLKISITPDIENQCIEKLRSFLSRAPWPVFVEQLDTFQKEGLLPFAEMLLYPVIMNNCVRFLEYVSTVQDPAKKLSLTSTLFAAFVAASPQNIKDKETLRQKVKELIDTCQHGSHAPALTILMSLFLRLQKADNLPLDMDFIGSKLAKITGENFVFVTDPIFHIALSNIASASKRPELLLPLIKATFDPSLWQALQPSSASLLLQASLCNTLPKAFESNLQRQLNTDAILQQTLKLFSTCPAQEQYLPSLIRLISIHVQRCKENNEPLDINSLQLTLTIISELVSKKLDLEHMDILLTTLSLISQGSQDLESRVKELVKTLTLKLLSALANSSNQSIALHELRTITSADKGETKTTPFAERLISLYFSKIPQIACNLAIFTSESEKSHRTAICEQFQYFLITLDSHFIGTATEQASILAKIYSHVIKNNFSSASILLKAFFLHCKKEDIFTVQMYRCRVLSVLAQALQSLALAKKTEEDSAIDTAAVQDLLKELTSCLFSLLDTVVEQRTENKMGHIKDVLSFGVKGYYASPEIGVYFLSQLAYTIFEREASQDPVNSSVLGMSLTALSKILEWEKRPDFAEKACHAACQRIMKFLELGILSKNRKVAEKMKTLKTFVIASCQGIIKTMLTTPVACKKE